MSKLRFSILAILLSSAALYGDAYAVYADTWKALNKLVADAQLPANSDSNLLRYLRTLPLQASGQEEDAIERNLNYFKSTFQVLDAQYNKGNLSRVNVEKFLESADYVALKHMKCVPSHTNWNESEVITLITPESMRRAAGASILRILPEG